MKCSKAILTVTLTLALTSVMAVADVLNVPGDYFSIQEAIDGAHRSDTVLVEPGIYVENLNINGKVLTVASLFLTTGDEGYIGSTIIDGNFKSSVVRVRDIEGENQGAIVGFTIQNGEVNNGGGIFCWNASPRVSHCYIRYNNGVSGGGILVVDASPTFEYCIIYENIGEIGGGLAAINSTVMIANCTIYGNTAVIAGGGVYSYESTVDIVNCILWENQPDQVYMARTGDPNSLHIGNSDIMDGIGGIVTNDNGELVYDDDNISEDPLFNDPKGGDFTFGEDSPCFGADMGAFNPPANRNQQPSALELFDALIEHINDLENQRRLNRNHANFIRVRVEQARHHYEFGHVIRSVCFLLDFDLRVAVMVWWRILSRDQGAYMIQCSNAILRQIGVECGDSMEGLELAARNMTPYEFSLSQNYPNPFNATTKIDYSLLEDSHVNIAVFDMTGRQVASLVDGNQEVGQYELTWNAQGNPAGMYLVRMQAGNFTSTKQMMYVK